jgi:hypothetical protein
VNKGRILHTAEPETLAGLFRHTLVEMTCENHVRAAKTLSSSGKFANVQSYGDRIHISGTGTVEQVSRQAEALLSADGLHVCKMKQVRPSIEDVFVELLNP